MDSYSTNCYLQHLTPHVLRHERLCSIHAHTVKPILTHCYTTKIIPLVNLHFATSNHSDSCNSTFLMHQWCPFDTCQKNIYWNQNKSFCRMGVLPSHTRLVQLVLDVRFWGRGSAPRHTAPEVTQHEHVEHVGHMSAVEPNALALLNFEHAK